MKTREELFEQLNHNPVFHLATIEDGKPRVRGMLLYKANEQGIIFHTGTFKSLYQQLQENPSVELCFNIQKTGEQIRIKGEVALIDSPELFEEIYQHPTRGFLRSYGDEIKNRMAVYRLEKGQFSVWTMASNLEPTVYAEF